MWLMALLQLPDVYYTCAAGRIRVTRLSRGVPPFPPCPKGYLRPTEAVAVAVRWFFMSLAGSLGAAAQTGLVTCKGYESSLPTSVSADLAQPHGSFAADGMPTSVDESRRKLNEVDVRRER